MKSQRPSIFRRLDRREIGPALAVVALALMIPLQVALPSRTPLPDDPGLAPRRARPIAVLGPPAYPKLAAAGLFSPDRSSGGSAGVTSGALDDWQAVGVAAIGGVATALVETSGGPPKFIRVGKTIGEWRLVRIDHDALTFQRGGERRRLVIGAPPPSKAPATKPAGQEDDQ